MQVNAPNKHQAQLPMQPVDRSQPVAGDTHLQKQTVATIPETADHTSDMPTTASPDLEMIQQQKKIIDRRIRNRQNSLKSRQRSIIKVRTLEQRMMQLVTQNKLLKVNINAMKNEHQLKRANSTFMEEMLQFQAGFNGIHPSAIPIDGRIFLGAPSPLRETDTEDNTLNDRQKLKRIVDCL